MGDNPFRHLPSVNEVLELPALQALAGNCSREGMVAAIREELDNLRGRLSAGEAIDGQSHAGAVAAGGRGPAVPRTRRRRTSSQMPIKTRKKT